VVSVGWRNTAVRLWNNNLVQIPNSRLADSVIINYNEPQNKSSFIITCGVAYDSDLKKVEKISMENRRNKYYHAISTTPNYSFRKYSS